MLKSLEHITDYLTETLCSEKGYSALFKAGVALVALSLLAVGDAGTFLYERDIEAHRNKFAVEAASGKPLADTTCETLNELVAECNVAKHEVRTLQASLELFSTVVTKSFWAGALFVSMATIGFALSPIVNSAKKRRQR